MCVRAKRVGCFKGTTDGCDLWVGHNHPFLTGMNIVMDETTELALAKLFAALWDTMSDNNSLDPQEIQDMLENSGLATWSEASEDEAEVSEGEIEEGDPLLLLTAEGKMLYLMGTTDVSNPDSP